MEYIVQGSKEENGSSQNKAASKPVQAEKTTSGAPGKCSIDIYNIIMYNCQLEVGINIIM